MKKTLFTIASICVKVLQYLFIFCAILTAFGTVAFISQKNLVLSYVKELSLNTPYFLFITVGFMGVIVLICYDMSAKYFASILKNMASENYFIQENSRFSLIITLLTLLIILVQLISTFVFQWFDIPKTSALFNFSHVNYFYNIIIVLIASAAYFIFKSGKATKDDAESII